ncbi:extracellular solute-binding protein [Shimia sp. SK013]|uniref:extracellular solute-binding protein n=1 Tax=Shimia sp. SK013 TaxID=1389006 RepID=UPI001F4CD745|nr:extracellular solute-binding protein [Shimia sp. SK013]
MALTAAATVVFIGSQGIADPSHGIAMYGAPALPADFDALPYANPDAPKGGRIVTGNTGAFDSLNPFVLKGNAPWQLRFFVYESLMGRNRAEPFALYGLLAESIETAPDRSWVEFTLRDEARFSDGSPVTVEDVIWSYETLGTEGHPRYHSLWKQMESIQATGPQSVRLTFNTDNRELALIAGLRPILKKAQFSDDEIADVTLNNFPIGSAPYVVSDFDPGRQVTLSRNPDYWGADVPVRRGTNNFDEIQIDFYGDGEVLFESFKAGSVSYAREFNAEKWANQYDFPATVSGDVVKSEIPHQKPSGITGFVMNTRRAPLNDIRVRDALMHSFNFEYINDTMTGGRQPRISSFFSGSQLAMRPGAAQDETAALLTQFADDLPPETLSGYTLPASDGSARDRRNMRTAIKLLDEAGWDVVEGKMQNADDEALALEILLPQNDSQNKAIVDIWRKALENLGIDVSVSLVDNAQYAQRLGSFDFDITKERRALSLSPGNEQRLYWGSDAAAQLGSRNLAGITSPAVDAMITEMLTAESQKDFVAATRALDRILTSGRYIIPIWTYAVGRIAHRREMRFPDELPIYGDGADWMPQFWWWQD